MPSADDSVVLAMFRLLAAAQYGQTRYENIDASTMDGITGITLVAMPTYLWDSLKVKEAQKLEELK